MLPTLNEADSIEEMVARVKKVGPSYKICVVDGGSSDGTDELARKAGASVISVKRGKGLAVKKAFSAIGSGTLVLLDSDSSYSPEEMPLLLGKLKGCEAVVGSRFRGRIEPGAMGLTNRIGNACLTWLANSLYGVGTTDLCSGFWAFKRKAFKKMEIDARHFTLEANFYVECATKNLKLCEVPITYCKRKGRTKLRITDGLEIGAYLVKKKLSSPPQVWGRARIGRGLSQLRDKVLKKH